jgi:hypothetical protein
VGDVHEKRWDTGQLNVEEGEKIRHPADLSYLRYLIFITTYSPRDCPDHIAVSIASAREGEVRN